ncbi:hypothetical protein KA005_58490, partial [bacterium]|nr:hypothetical protein [bacterium]
FEKFQQQHGLRDIHKILNNSIDILVSYFLWTPLRCPERSRIGFIMGCNYRRVMIRKEHEWKLEGR